MVRIGNDGGVDGLGWGLSFEDTAIIPLIKNA